MCFRTVPRIILGHQNLNLRWKYSHPKYLYTHLSREQKLTIYNEPMLISHQSTEEKFEKGDEIME